MAPDLISCEESLAALSTAPASELGGDSPVARHAASCPQCARVAQVVLERERSLAFALDNLTSGADPAVISETAMLARERHGTGRVIWWLLIGAFVVTIGFALDDTLGTRERAVAASMRVETIDFSCLDPTAAEQLIEPFVRSNGHGIYPAPSPFHTLTIRATPNEIATARSVLAKYDAEIASRDDAKQICTPPVATTASTPKP